MTASVDVPIPLPVLPRNLCEVCADPATFTVGDDLACTRCVGEVLIAAYYDTERSAPVPVLRIGAHR